MKMSEKSELFTVFVKYNISFHFQIWILVFIITGTFQLQREKWIIFMKSEYIDLLVTQLTKKTSFREKLMQWTYVPWSMI